MVHALRAACAVLAIFLAVVFTALASRYVHQLPLNRVRSALSALLFLIVSEVAACFSSGHLFCWHLWGCSGLITPF